MPKNIFNSLKRYVDRAKSNARSAVMRASYVDTRSDTTRKGYHEGRTRYGYNYGANENGITGTIARVIDGKDYNPYLQTGIAPMPDKIASPKNLDTVHKIGKAIQRLIPKYNKFAEYYGYNVIPKGTSTQEAERIIKAGLEQHNTFYRGLTYPEGEKLESVKKVLGKNASKEDVMNYLAKVGSRDKNNTYFSLDERANQYARTGDVAKYIRKYTLGENPDTWIEDADFTFDATPATSFAPKGSVNYPWAGSYIKEVPGEVRINPEDVVFKGWMPKTKWEYGEYVKPSEYRANKNMYFNEKAGGTKPKFRLGGIYSLY